MVNPYSLDCDNQESVAIIMIIFQKIGVLFSKWFGSPEAHNIERAVAISALPVIEKTAVTMSQANPVTALAVQVVVLPAIQTEIEHLEQPPETSPKT